MKALTLRVLRSAVCLLLLSPLVCAAAATLTAYDCWGNLAFEDRPPVNISFWSANGAAVAFIDDPAQAHAGRGALRIDGGSPVSVWGARVAGSTLPQPGHRVGGFFWLKLLAAPSAIVDVRMTGYRDGAETVYCRTAAVDLSTLPLNTWTRVELVSSGHTVLAGSDINFNIVSAGGATCLVDDVTFGALTETADPEPPTPPVPPSADAAVVPLFAEYVGSTFNGDFEVGNATVGNQYWGQYVPNQAAVSGSPPMMQLHTAPVAPAPGAPKSGANMVSIRRGGVAWNIAALAAMAEERLPRPGDLVGGACWLYVPADADLSAGIPVVSVVHQTATQGDVTVSDTSAFPAAGLVKGAWNRLPLYPKGGATIGAHATAAAILVTAPSLDAATNRSYPSPYYIDDIRVGAIPRGLFFGSTSRLVNASGATISEPAPGDEELRVEAVVQNSTSASPREALVVLKLFQRDVLARSVTKAVSIPAIGATGISHVAVTLRAPLQGLDRATLNARLHLHADQGSGEELAPPRSLLQRTRPVSHADPALRYVGRWVEEGAGRRGNWIRPYFKATFSRSTSVGIRLLAPASLSVVLDGVRTDYNSVNGHVVLGANLSASATHTLQVAGLTWRDSVIFDGLLLDDTAVLRESPLRRDHIEFIGDSITAWDNGYSWRVPAALEAEGTRVAWPGIALRDGFGYYTVPPGSVLTGMASAYLKNGMPGYGSAGDWDFTGAASAPNILVVNLGTNDFAAIQGNAPQVSAFQGAFTTLLQNARARHPAAEIFVLRPFTIGAADVQAAIRSAALGVVDAGDSRVHYVDTSSWGVAIGPDGIHPTDAGHATISEKLVALLRPHLRGGSHPQAPALTGADSAACAAGRAFSLVIGASGAPAPTFDASGLPAWASLHPVTGLLSGTPPRAGRHVFTLRATNSEGMATQEFTLLVTADYARWAADHFSPAQLADPAVSGAEATPLHDGLPNLLKYAFDLAPTSSLTPTAMEFLPHVGLKHVGAKRYLTLSYLENLRASGVAPVLQSSADLRGWSDHAPDLVEHIAVQDERLVEAGVALDGEPRRFLRLRLAAR